MMHLHALIDTQLIKIIIVYAFVILFEFQGVQLHIEIIDEDRKTNDDLIDVLLIDHSLPIGQPAPRQTYTGIYSIQFVTMDLSIVARCVGNFQGPDCSRCISGFAGPMCDVRIDDSECIDLCNGRGQCVDGVPILICDCVPGFTGAMCENIDDCVGVNCSGNGLCVDGESSYSCDCDPDFTGMECEVNIDDCVGVNCSGNGQCVDGIKSFSCNCNDSYKGPLCETRARANDNEGVTLTIADSKTLHRLVNSIPQMP